MVWYQYVLDTLHGEDIELSPKSPKTPVIDPQRFLTEDEATDLFFYMKQVCHDAIYDGCILDVPQFNSFSLQEFINSRRFNESIVDQYFEEDWLPTYRYFLRQLWEYTNRQLVFSGKRIRLPRNVFYKFVFYYSSGYITEF